MGALTPMTVMRILKDPTACPFYAIRIDIFILLISGGFKGLVAFSFFFLLIFCSFLTIMGFSLLEPSLKFLGGIRYLICIKVSMCYCCPHNDQQTPFTYDTFLSLAFPEIHAQQGRS